MLRRGSNLSPGGLGERLSVPSAAEWQDTRTYKSPAPSSVPEPFGDSGRDVTQSVGTCKGRGRGRVLTKRLW